MGRRLFQPFQSFKQSNPLVEQTQIRSENGLNFLKRIEREISNCFISGAEPAYHGEASRLSWRAIPTAFMLHWARARYASCASGFAHARCDIDTPFSGMLSENQSWL